MLFHVIGNGNTRLLLIQRMLTRAGHVCNLSADVESAGFFNRFVRCDAFIVQNDGAAADNVDAIKGLSRRFPGTPIIAIVEANDARDVCALLEHGAQDFVFASDGTDKLLAVAIALVRRANGYAHSELHIGALQLHLGTHQCVVGHDVIHLTPIEYRLVEALALRKEQLVSRKQLLFLIYPIESEPSPKSIDLFVHNIRTKFRSVLAGSPVETCDKGFILHPAPALSDIV